jgi:hypothetical protein
MTKDEREQEREFVEGLKARTGRDLAQWMAVIAAQGFTDKNEIIDWLRGQGLPFARASWLERIHRNGGRPIHGDAPAGEAGGPSRPTATAVEARAAAAPKALSAADAAALEKLLSAAKGYRPLYHLLEAGIREAVPAAGFFPHGRYVSVAAPAEFAAVVLSAAEVRLGLDLGDRGFDETLQKAKLRGPGPAITHMVVLTDARQVNDTLLSLIRTANGRVNG